MVPTRRRRDRKAADSKKLASRSAAQSRRGEARVAPVELADTGPVELDGEGPVDVQTLLHLQRTVGNQAVGQLVAQRQTRVAEPQADSKFQELTADVEHKQRVLHAPRSGRAAAAGAQAAALAPPDDREAQAKTAQAGKMAAAKPGEFDRAAFIGAVEQAIAAQAPQTLGEAADYAGSGKADRIKDEVRGHVTRGKETTAGPVTDATKAAPDLSVATDKPVSPLQPDQPPATPGAPDPSKAVPDKAPASATDLSAGPRQVAAELDQNQVTKQQLKDGNEPEFDAALDRTGELERHSETAPEQLRATEANVRDGAERDAGQHGATAMLAMATQRRNVGQGVQQGQQTTRGSDESKRAQVTATLQKVFDTTRRDVEEILTGLDRKVEQQFDAEEGEARKAFTADMQRRMDAYKDQRYSGFTGKLRWVKDKLMGLPPEANEIFVAARNGYVASMRQVISRIADTIGGELTRAKARIAQGRADLEAEVHKLPADLRALGQEAAAGFESQFEELNAGVDSKGQELVQTLAGKYTEAMKAVDAEIDAEKAKNQGLVDAAIGAIKGVIDTIIELKNMLMGVLARAVEVIGPILAHPIAFVGRLFSAIGGGLKNFIANIGDHLKKGLVSWLMGAATEAGIEVPDKFDLKGIIQLIAGLLGLTWQSIRSRIVARGIPDEAISAAEQAVPEAQLLAREGLPGLWQQIMSKIGDLKGMILGQLTEFLIPTVLVAGITWVISLLNPASAFVKAIKAIIDVVRFIVERGAQIVQFVNAVLDAIVAIAKGTASGVEELIENALARSIPVLIGFLAAILGVGGIANKVKEIIQAVSRPVTKVVNWVVDKIVGVAKKFWGKLKGVFGGGRGPENEAAMRRRLDSGVRAGVAAVGRLSGNRVSAALIRPVLASIRLRYRMQVLEPVVRDGRWSVRGVVNPEKEEPTTKEAGGADDKKFPYELTAATKGHVKTAPVGAAVEHLDEIEPAPMEGKDPMTGFVVNMAATPGEVKPGMAARYLSDAWAGSGAAGMAAERTAVVIGVNTLERLDPKANQAASQAIVAKLGTVTRPAGLRMAVFGFQWTPTWIRRGGGPVDFGVVRAAYEKLPPDEQKAAVASNEGHLAEKEALPYGIFREVVLGSAYTRRAVDILRKVNSRVHILSQDADTEVAARGGLGVLAAYDKILREMGQHPLLTIGGYHFDGFNWGPGADPRMAQLTRLANELDRAVRVAINGVHPQMLYPTEPNMLIKAWDSGVGDGIFQKDEIIRSLASDPGSVYGVGHAEGRNLRNNLMNVYGDDFSMAYVPEAGVTTSPAPENRKRGLTVRPESVGAGGAHRVDAILAQSQSYASAETLAREFAKANPALTRADRDALQRGIFRHFDEIARLMVDHPELTKDSSQIKEHLAQLRRTVANFPGTRGGANPALKEAASTAQTVMQEIIGAMTAQQFKDLWHRLRTQLDQVVQDNRQNGGAQQ